MFSPVLFYSSTPATTLSASIAQLGGGEVVESVEKGRSMKREALVAQSHDRSRPRFYC